MAAYEEENEGDVDEEFSFIKTSYDISLDSQISLLRPADSLFTARQWRDFCMAGHMNQLRRAGGNKEIAHEKKRRLGRVGQVISSHERLNWTDFIDVRSSL